MAQELSLRKPPVIPAAERCVRAVMLPRADSNGELPRGVHVASWMEIQERFAGGSTVRARAFSKLKYLHELAGRTGCPRKFYIFGSFVSGTPEPRDVDLVLVMASGFRVEDSPRESRALFSHPDAQARYGASIFWLREGQLSRAAMREFLEVWQTKRDRRLRGILEVR